MDPLEKVSGLNVICNLFCLHGFYPYYINSINQNWLIADLASWYLIAPLRYKFLNSLEKMIGALLIIVPIDYLVLILLEKHPLISSEVLWRNYVSNFCFLAELLIILLGCAINYVTSGIHKKTSYAGGFFALLSWLYIDSNKISIYSKIFSYGICFTILKKY